MSRPLTLTFGQSVMEDYRGELCQFTAQVHSGQYDINCLAQLPSCSDVYSSQR